MTPLIEQVETGWPLMVWPQAYADLLQYDWWSGLWEISDEAIARYGAGIGGWLHVFHVLAEVR